MSNTNKTVAGDLNVERHITSGGDLTVRGQAKICHDLKVEGWLEAKNIKGPAKGLFGSVTQLEERYPHPQDGWWAMVGESVPAPIYRADGGAWVATGKEGGTPSIDVSEFLQAAIEAVGGATARFDDIVDDGEIRRSTCTKAGGRIVYVASKKVFSYQIDGALYSDWLVEDVPSADMYMDDTRTLMQADKLYICGGTCYMSSPDVGLLQLARYSDIEALLSRLQGTSPESSAETDPFLSLGTFTGEDVWEQVAETLNGLVVTEEAETHRRAGLCRLSVDGARVEVVNFPLDYAAQTQVQLLTGCVVSEDGVSLSRGDWQQLVRSHSKEGGWTNWKPAVQGRTDFAGINAIAGIEQYAKAGNAISEVRSLAVVAQHDGKDVTVGRLWMLSDSMTHQLTQVLLTHHEPGNDGSFSAHTDGTVHLWKRSYGLIQGSAESAPIGEWTEWTDLLAKPTVVTSTKDGFASSEMFTRILQQEVYMYSNVAPDDENHYAQLGAKLLSWCSEGAPILRSYETNNGSNGGYRQGIALLYATKGGGYKFIVCFEASGENGKLMRSFLLRYAKSGSSWSYSGYVKLIDGGGELSELERQLEEVAAVAVEAQTGVTEGDPQAGFDGFVDSATIQMSSTTSWSSIVFVKDKKAFAAQQGLQYFSSWMTKDEDMTHGAPMAYGKRGKTHLLTTSGELYVRLADGALEKVCKTEDLASRVEEVEEAVWPTQASLTAGKTLLEYTGAAQAVKLSWSVKRKGAAVGVTSLVVTKSAGSGESEQVYSGTDNPGTQEAMVNFYGLTSFALKTEVSGKSYTASTRVQMVLPVYAGFAEAASDVGITSLVKQSLRTSAAGTYTLTNAATGNYLWLCVPSTMTVNRVTLNGFDVPMEAAEDGETTLGGYKCYRSSNQLTAQDFTFVVS